ncbi:MAG TPA: hypothetical protein VJ598_12505 [Albitalea sp.]|nr:hypothetical protein [Albitalea sp.]
MDVGIHSLHWERRLPDWPAAAVAGFAAGAVLMVLELLWSLVGGESPWRASHQVAAIVLGADAQQSSGFALGVVTVALATHYALGIAFGIVLAALIAPLRLEANVAASLAAGALFGALLYLFDFYAMVRWFPWFAELRGVPTLVAHLVFGMSAALLYWEFERGGADR